MKKSESNVKSVKVDKTKREKYIAEKNLSKKEKKKRENIFKRITRYFRGVITETRRIKWTTIKDLIKYSLASVVFVLFFGIYFYGIDWIALLVRSLAN